MLVRRVQLKCEEEKLLIYYIKSEQNLLNSYFDSYLKKKLRNFDIFPTKKKFF